MPSTSHKVGKVTTAFWVMLTVLLITLALNFFYLITSKNDLLVMLHNPFLSYEMRLRLKLGSPFYEYIKYLQKNIPVDAIVQLPPQLPAWDNYGSGTYMNYFLYPRKLIWTQLVKDKISPNATYALVIRGHTTPDSVNAPIWPENYSTNSANLLQTNPELGFIKLKHD